MIELILQISEDSTCIAKISKAISCESFVLFQRLCTSRIHWYERVFVIFCFFFSHLTYRQSEIFTAFIIRLHSSSELKKNRRSSSTHTFIIHPLNGGAVFSPQGTILSVPRTAELFTEKRSGAY